MKFVAWRHIQRPLYSAILTFGVAAMVSCASIRLRYQAEIEVEKKTAGSKKPTTVDMDYTYDVSLPTTGHMIGCIATFWAYGGWCWAYLSMPHDSQIDAVERKADRHLTKALGSSDYYVVEPVVHRIGWSEGAPSADLEVYEDEDSADVESQVADVGELEVVAPDKDTLGSTLFLGNKPYPVRKQSFTIKDEIERYDYKLRADDGRVIEHGQVNSNQLSLDPSTWYVGLGIAEARNDDPAFNRLFLNERMMDVGLRVGYQPSRFGLLLSYHYQSDEALGRVDSSYEHSELLLGPTYEFVPFSRARNGMEWLHLKLNASAVYSSHSLTVSDSYVSISDRSNNFGGSVGFELRYPALSNIWLFGFVQMTWQKVKLDRFQYNQDVQSQLAGLGLDYAL